MQHLKIKIVFLFLLSAINAFGQNNFQNWYFGQNAALSFATNPPTSLSGSQMIQQEGCASVSDNSGNLLFYTDGVKVWDKTHNVMPDGFGLMGHLSSAQSALIVPMPGYPSKYYLFTVNYFSNTNNGDLRYSIVDMSLNGGNGNIVSTQKNILLSANQTEKLVAASGTCGVWIITHQRTGNRFESRLITSIGINNPIYTDIGTVYFSDFTYGIGIFKVSKNNQKLATSINGGIVELYNFNPFNGVLSNRILLPLAPMNDRAYGLCFSQDNTKLYEAEGVGVGQTNRIYQYDISSSNAGTIISSKTLAGQNNTAFGDMQLGPNGQIYIVRESANFLSVISNPNLNGIQCGFILNALSLGINKSKIGLPNEIKIGGNAIPLNLGNDTTLCPGDMLTLSSPNANSYLWSTGATSQTINVAVAGQYWVRVYDGSCFKTDTINIYFTQPNVNLGNDTTLCQGQNLLLNAGSANNYQWSTGATTQTINVVTPGQYWVKVYIGSCFKADTINVSYTTLPPLNIGNDTTLCQGQTLLLNAGIANSYQWSTGAITQTINVSVAGQYWVKAFNGNCFKADTINVSYNSPPIVSLGNDTTLCIGQSLVLNAGIASSYQWSTGAITQTINVSMAGQYWVKAFNGNCSKADTINVSYNTPPIVSLGNDTTLCQGQSLVLNAGNATGYQWSTGAITQTINVSMAGQYWVKAFNGNCSKADTINVSYNAPPVVSLGNDTTLCQGQSLVLNAGNATGYQWSTGATTQTINVSIAGQYWVKAFNGNCSKADTINVIVYPIPDSIFTPDTTLCTQQILILNAGKGNNYLWSTGDTTQKLKISHSGSYWVDVNYYNLCKKRFSTIVYFKDCDCVLYIPNAFTPNSDGLNDIFKPALKNGCQFINFTIYNRWGQKVFETANLDEGWNGKINGNDQNSDVFTWQITAIKDGSRKLFKGTVLLLR